MLPIAHFVLARLSNRRKQTLRPLPPSCLMVLESGSPRPYCRATVFVCFSQQVRHDVGEYILGIASLSVVSPIPSGPRQKSTLRQVGIRSLVTAINARYASDVGQIVILAPILIGQHATDRTKRSSNKRENSLRCCHIRWLLQSSKIGQVAGRNQFLHPPRH